MSRISVAPERFSTRLQRVGARVFPGLALISRHPAFAGAARTTAAVRLRSLGAAILSLMAVSAGAQAAGPADGDLTAKDRSVIAIAERVAHPSVLATPAALDAFGQEALKLSGRRRLTRLSYILYTQYYYEDERPYLKWSGILHREAERAHDQRYQDLASLLDMLEKDYHSHAGHNFKAERALVDRSWDPLIKAVAWLEASFYDTRISPQEQANAINFAETVASFQSGEERAILHSLALYRRERLFAGLDVKAQTVQEIFDTLEKYHYPQDALGAWQPLFASAIDTGDFPLAEQLYERRKALAPSLALGGPEHASSDSACVALGYREGDFARVLTCADQADPASLNEPSAGPQIEQMKIIALLRLGRAAEARAAYAAFRASPLVQNLGVMSRDRRPTIEALFRASRNGSLGDLGALMDADGEVLSKQTKGNEAVVDVLAKEYSRNTALNRSVMVMQGGLLAVCAVALLAGLLALRSQMRLARRLKKAKAEAEAANEAKSQFLATISHEIRTPLNGVLGLSQVMANDDLSPRQADRLIMIRRSGANLMALLNDILDLSRIEAGHLELDEIAYDIRDVAEGLVGTFQPQAQAKGLKLSMLLEPQALGSYRGDVVRLNQIVSNLVANAVKFTEAGEISITIGHSEAGLEIKVRDTGPGMDEETAKRIFARFVQGDASATRRYGGAGLGLAIARELCEAMGGRLTVTSNLGEGSVFVLHLPQPRVVHLARKTQGADPVSTAFAALKQRRLRVLAAEDDAISATVLKSLLDEIEAETVMVDDGMKAVAAFEAGAFDLVLLDLEMPALDGLDAVRLMRAQEEARGQARTPMLAVTAAAMAHQLRTCLSAGFDDRLTKPLLAEEVWITLWRAQARSNEAHPWAEPVVQPAKRRSGLSAFN